VSDLNGYPAIYAINSDGSGLTMVFDDLYGIMSPAWSPDGSRIAFTADSRESGHFDIFTVQADGSGLVNLTNSSDEEEMYPAWSPDGTRLAFMSASLAGAVELTILDLNSLTRSLAPHKMTGWEDSPVWSPDGNQLAFDSQGDGLPGIYVVTIGESGSVRLTDPVLVASQPAWSPDGKRIVFSANQDNKGINDIFMMNADGSHPTNLTNSVEGASYPVWAPDGKKIAFVASEGAGNSDIYIMDASGGKPSLLIDLHADIHFLSWGTASDLLPTATPSIPATPTTTPVPPSPDDWKKAQQTLLTYFDDLHAGQYEQAVQLYGGSYLELMASEPIRNPHDHAGFFEHACQSLLRCCLRVKSIQLKDQTSDEFRFTLEFLNDDGSLFVLGPCCGGNGDSQSQFPFRVTLTREGKFLVMDLPVYVP
jgi:dipeptidyl aminopeptidase/acylaminoacyl peptidase